MSEGGGGRSNERVAPYIREWWRIIKNLPSNLAFLFARGYDCWGRGGEAFIGTIRVGEGVCAKFFARKSVAS